MPARKAAATSKAAATAAKGEAKAKRAAEAKANGNGSGEPEAAAEAVPAKIVKWEGIELVLPETMPDTVTFDLVEFEATSSPMAIFRTLRSILGAEQFLRVRYALEEMSDDDPAGAKLIDVIFDAYGTDLGES